MNIMEKTGDRTILKMIVNLNCSLSICICLYTTVISGGNMVTKEEMESMNFTHEMELMPRKGIMQVSEKEMIKFDE